MRRESREFELIGLEPDNLLAFLALLGTLRSLERERPDWAARARWWGPPTRPRVTIDAVAPQEAFVEAIASGCASLGAYHEFGNAKDIGFDRATAREQLETATLAGSDKAMVFGALMSDGAIKPDGKVQPTPICLMFGQGHQHFLERLANVPQGRASGASAKKRDIDLHDPAYIERALLAPWSRSDATDGFRWDPEDDRRYALRFGDPSSEVSTTEHGANRLAAVAVPLLTVFPARRFGRASLTVRGFSAGEGGTRFTWPIWDKPAPLATIIALLDHPELGTRRPRAQRLAALSVVDVRRSRRISVGKFLNFTRAESVLEA